MLTARSLVLAATAAGLLTTSATAQDLAAFEKRVTVKVLANGLTLLVCERRDAPVVSFFTHVNVGSAQEVPGITGLAHMFEHMAFKGTPRIGTKNWGAEQKALAQVEETYASYDRERRRELGRDAAKIAAAEKAWKEASKQADTYVARNEFAEIIQREGGAGLNAFTSSDETGYFFSFPSNRLELWAHLESQRFLHPVLREFYKERSVVMEERRMRTDSKPIGRLIEQFLSAAFTAHTYGQPGIGWPSDLQSFSATDAKQFFQKHYIPKNVTIGIVGDVDSAEAVRIVEQHFGRWASAQRPEPLRTVEPVQRSERTVTIVDPSQPIYIEGYHRPAVTHADDVVFNVIQDLLSRGRTSRLYRSLVRDKKVAAESGGFNGFPGSKYPHMFVVYAVPLPGKTNEEVRDGIRAELDRLTREPASEAELKMVRTRAKARLLRKLDNNMGLAQALAFAHARLGDWRELFRHVDAIEKVTAADVLRVAKETFVTHNRTVGILQSSAPAQGVQQ